MLFGCVSCLHCHIPFVPGHSVQQNQRNPCTHRRTGSFSLSPRKISGWSWYLASLYVHHLSSVYSLSRFCRHHLKYNSALNSLIPLCAVFVKSVPQVVRNPIIEKPSKDGKPPSTEYQEEELLVSSEKCSCKSSFYCQFYLVSLLPSQDTVYGAVVRQCYSMYKVSLSMFLQFLPHIQSCAKVT